MNVETTNTYKELVKLHALILDGDLTEAAQLCDKLIATLHEERRCCAV